MSQSVLLYTQTQPGEMYTDEAITLRHVSDPDSLEAALRSEAPTAIVVDITTNTQDQIAAIKTLKTRPGQSKASILALVEPEQRQLAREAGADELLTAPLDPVELDVRLRTLVAARGARLSDLQGSIDVLAHDLYNPLGIIGFSRDLMTEILEEEDEVAAEELEPLVTNINMASRRLRFMIDDFLDYVRMTARALPVAKKPVDLRPAIAAAADMATMIGGENGIEIHEDLPEEMPKPMGDQNLFHRVMQAALDTSVKFCQPNSTIRIEVKPEPDAVRVTITDPGQPVASQFDVEALFGIKETSRAREAGSRTSVSMSLPFIKLAMQHMGGRVELVSDTETGKTYLHLWLPLDS
ncbi:MAG: hypothetical protein GYB66_16060 [Chloroflexi bacterium]|nr:hypothetical protein [Chloroflexota bacterium]